MKKKLSYGVTFFALVILVSYAFASVGGWNITSPPNEKWFSGSRSDPAWNWMKAADKMIEASQNVGTGEIFYVDSGVTTSLDGKSWAGAVSTLDAAIALCTTARGDIIYIAQGHSEVKAAAGDVFTLDIAGVTVIGVSNGASSGPVAAGAVTLSLMPVFILDHADATATVSAPNCKISGVRFESDVIDNAAGMTVSAAADGLIVTNCVFADGAAAEELVIGISVAAAADDLQIVNNRFYTTPAGACASAISLAGESARSVISGNFMQGDYSASCIDGVTAAATLLTITDNYLINIDTTAGSCIDMHASTTGMTCNNRMMSGHSMANAWIAAGMVSIENYATGAVSASGLVEPGVDAD